MWPNCYLDFAKMSKIIEHNGIVKNVCGGYADIMIIQYSACAGCHAKSACTAADKADKIITVPVGSRELQIGDKVIITGSTIIGWKAVLYAFVIPFVFLMAVLIGVSVFFNNELYAGIAALVVLIPYYIVLYFLKDKMKNKFTFTLKDY